MNNKFGTRRWRFCYDSSNSKYGNDCSGNSDGDNNVTNHSLWNYAGLMEIRFTVSSSMYASLSQVRYHNFEQDYDNGNHMPHEKYLH